MTYSTLDDDLAHFQLKCGRGFVSENALGQVFRPPSDGKPDSTFPESGLSDKKTGHIAAGLGEYWVVDMPRGQVLRLSAPVDRAHQAAEPIPAGAPCPSLTMGGVALDTASWPWDQGEQ